MLLLLLLYLILAQESLLQIMRVQAKEDGIDQFSNLRLIHQSDKKEKNNKPNQRHLKPDDYDTELTSIEKTE